MSVLYCALWGSLLHTQTCLYEHTGQSIKTKTFSNNPTQILTEVENATYHPSSFVTQTLQRDDKTEPVLQLYVSTIDMRHVLSIMRKSQSVTYNAKSWIKHRTSACVLKIVQDAWGCVTANQSCLCFLSFFLSPSFFCFSTHFSCPPFPLILLCSPHSCVATVALRAMWTY